MSRQGILSSQQQQLNEKLLLLNIPDIEEARKIPDTFDEQNSLHFLCGAYKGQVINTRVDICYIQLFP